MAEINAVVSQFNLGRYVEGERLARDMAMAFPESGFAWKALGAMLKALGRSSDAIMPMERALALSPLDYQAHNNLGSALGDVNRLLEADECYLRALELKPDFTEAMKNLARNRMVQGRFVEAEAGYRKALEFGLNDVDVYFGLGIVLNAQNRLEEAEAAYRSVISLSPDHADAQMNLGNVLRRLGNYSEAEVALRRVLALRPDSVEGHYNLGGLKMEQGCFVEAESCYLASLKLRLDLAEAENGLGNSLNKQGRLLDAESAFRRALAANPDYAEASSNLGNVLNDQGRFVDALACHRSALALRPDDPAAYSNFLLSLNYGAHYSQEDCLGEACQYGQMLEGITGGRFATWNCEMTPDRLRVGLVSGDLRSHPVGYFVESLLEHLDPARVELIAYPTQHDTDDLTARIRPRFSAWKPLAFQSDEAAAQTIHADGVHVLIDLAGHSAYNRLPVFAWKPAPVQVSWPGYFATTGLAAMDYIFADEMGVPPVVREQFTETVWYLPDTRLCFTAPNLDLPVVPPPSLKTGNITFGSFQNYAKIGDEVLSAWSEIMKAIPGARLRMQCRQLVDPALRVLFKQRLQQCGIEPERVTVHGMVDREAYLAAHGEVDMLLDTFPFPGGTTTCEALWMGVPTLTLAGRTMLSRQGASLMTAAGLPEWIVTSRADYVKKAISFAADLSSLAALRADLRQKVLASPLFDAPRFARHFEKALWEVFDRWVKP